MNFLSEYLCERMDCVPTRGMVLQQVQSIKICVHENSIDQHVSGSLRSKGMWEEHIVTPFLHLVKRFPQAVVLGESQRVTLMKGKRIWKEIQNLKTVHIFNENMCMKTSTLTI
jgi:hypothetical protein